MIDLTGVRHHPAIDEIVAVLCNQTQNTDTGFFRTEVAYFLAKMASCMRATIVTKDRGAQPVNGYAIGLATSGYGKGHSVGLMEQEFMKGFARRFLTNTMKTKSDENLWIIANERAVRDNTNPQDEYDKVAKDYFKCGAYSFTFDEGTVPAVKQLRTKLLMADIGAINFQVDEIGMNLDKSVEMLTVYLELYDQGRVKNKLTKNTTDSERIEELDGSTPANMLLFGTPSKLLDGGKTEELFYSLLDTGYARRSLFGFGDKTKKSRNSLSAAEIYQKNISPENQDTINRWADYFHELADPARHGWRMELKDTAAIRLIEYKIACEQAADEMRDTQAIQKAEMEHRFSKALKLAGAYAFVDGSNEIEMDAHLLPAILLVEESGAAFQKILYREKLHVRLGKYLADMAPMELTQHDLTEDLPYYKGSATFKNEMMTLATSWGYTHNVIIKRNFVGTVEFFQAETLKETDIDKMKLSYSDHWAYHNVSEEVPFTELHNLTQAAQEDGSPMHWTNHHFKGGTQVDEQGRPMGHRSEENALPGFNMIVLDVDGGAPLALTHELFKEFRFLTYTTKRHTDEAHRYRLILPINYVLEMSSDEYKEFMNSVFTWLPFKTDESSNQRSKKWETFAGGTYHYNEGVLFDALPFIPKTRKNDEYLQSYAKVENLDNLERWFAARMGGVGSGRNNLMIKYALALVDMGLDLTTISGLVHGLDRKLPSPMGIDEINRSIMVTVARRFMKQAA